MPSRQQVKNTLSPDDIVPGTTHGLPYVTCFVGLHSGIEDAGIQSDLYLDVSKK